MDVLQQMEEPIKTWVQSNWSLITILVTHTRPVVESCTTRTAAAKVWKSGARSRVLGLELSNPRRRPVLSAPLQDLSFRHRRINFLQSACSREPHIPLSIG